MISTRVHGLIDYAAGIFLILAPYLFKFSTAGVEHWIAEGVGLSVILVSLATRYELGFFKLIPLNIHFLLDILVGTILLISLAAFGFDKTILIPFLTIGLAGFAVPLLTKRS